MSVTARRPRPVLAVRDLSVRVAGPAGTVTVVSDVSFDLSDTDILGLVGESGSGKSLTATAVLGLTPPGVEVAGTVLIDGRNVLTASERQWRRLRGSHVAMIFQDASKALDPRLRVGQQIAETVRTHLGSSRSQARRRAVELLEEVGLPDATSIMAKYPHQLSGGMQQRVMIAVAISGDPSILVADEATSALDLTTQNRIVALLAQLAERRKMSVLFITHDIALMAGLCERSLIMYAGQIVEEGPTTALLEQPRHPYTSALLAATPMLATTGELSLPRGIPGAMPPLGRMPPGCRFAPRCGHRTAGCAAPQRLTPVADDRDRGRSVRCHRSGDLRLGGLDGCR